MSRKEHHVVYYEKGGWDVKKDSAVKEVFIQSKRPMMLIKGGL